MDGCIIDGRSSHKVPTTSSNSHNPALDDTNYICISKSYSRLIIVTCTPIPVYVSNNTYQQTPYNPYGVGHMVNHPPRFAEPNVMQVSASKNKFRHWLVLVDNRHDGLMCENINIYDFVFMKDSQLVALYSLTHPLTHSLTHSLTLSFTHSLIHSHHSLTHITHSHPLTYSPTHSPSLIHSLTYPLTLLTHSLTHSLTIIHSLTHITHSHHSLTILTHSLTLIHLLTHSLSFTHSLTHYHSLTIIYSLAHSLTGISSYLISLIHRNRNDMYVLYVLYVCMCGQLMFDFPGDPWGLAVFPEQLQPYIPNMYAKKPTLIGTPDRFVLRVMCVA
jgi:hypothetical protein